MSAFGGTDRHEHLRIWNGVTAQAIEGDRTTLAIVDLEPGSTVPEHHHDNEQLGSWSAGRCGSGSPTRPATSCPATPGAF